MGRFALLLNKQKSGIPLTFSGIEWKPVLLEIKQAYSHVKVSVNYVTGETVAHLSAANVAGLNLSAISPEIASAPAIKKVKVNLDAVVHFEEPS